MTLLCICGHAYDEHDNELRCSHLDFGTFFCPCIAFRMSTLTQEQVASITAEQRVRFASRLYDEALEQTLRLYRMPTAVQQENAMRQDRELPTRRERVI